MPVSFSLDKQGGYRCMNQLRNTIIALLTILTLSLILVACGENQADTLTEQALSEGAEGTRFSVTTTEGNLVILDPKTIDPDGDEVTLAYEAPVDSKGRWQTKVGDAGTHRVLVTATDTKGASTTEYITIIVNPLKRGPSIDCSDKLAVREGETVTINCAITSGEGDVVVLYDGWMTDATYTTNYEDAGTHTVTVIADDGERVATKDLTIVVSNVNRPPVFPNDFPETMNGEAGDVFAISTAEVYDPDGDDVVITYAAPFDKDGLWASTGKDAGEYRVDVLAFDGSASEKRTVTVIVRPSNTAPVLTTIQDFIVSEGDTITLPLHATDREGDTIFWTIEGWFTTKSYTTGYEDAGEHTVTVTASDGKLSDRQVVHIIVHDSNRPPYFVRQE